MDFTPLRSRPVVLLIAATLLTSLALGIGFVVVQRHEDRAGDSVRRAEPLTDEQAKLQVLEPARHFVAAGRFRAPTASYVLSSCASEEKPPYQGRVYLNFDIPSITETPAYFRGIAAAMTARGWHEGLPPNRHPGGRTLAKDGVTAIYYRNPDVPGRGVLEVSGECRATTDHSLDNSGFIDITGQLRR